MRLLSTSILVIFMSVSVMTETNLFAAEDSHATDHDAHDHGHHAEDTIKGPHGGRLLQEDDFSLEISIYETGLPPEFRVFAYRHKQPLAADDVSLVIELTRLGGTLDRIEFTPQGDYLRGNSVVYEPHSFEVEVSARHAGKTYTWQYQHFEGRTRIAESMARQMGILTETAGPVTIAETRTLSGRVQTNPNRLSRVRPRFAGVVKAIRSELGDRVSAGDTLATVQSNESLQVYDVKAPIDGLIVKRDIQLGEATADEPLFIIVDLSEVWVELDIFVRDLELISKGQPVLVETLDGRHHKSAVIDWISPLTAHASQSVRARVALANEDGTWRPGQFVRGHVTVGEFPVPLAVRLSALQRFRDSEVVFAHYDDTYEVRMLKLGRRNRDWAEVLEGLEAGTEYVTGNSYLIKADIEKAGAGHDH
jgi:cobalt-zinc-cadmium efflux system membrane fusion protein